MRWPWPRRRAAVPDIDPSSWRQASAGLPWLRAIDDARDGRLRALVAEFLARKAITPLHGLALNEVQRLRLALMDLRPEEQEVFLLRQNGELTYEQIAEMHNRPVGTVKTQMRSALQKLRKVLV